LHRRRFFQLGLAAGAGLVTSAAGPAFAQAVDGCRQVSLHNLHTGEKLEAIYWDNGRYVPDAMAAVNKVLRDYRTNDEHDMDPRLIDLLAQVSGKVGCSAPFQVISGYRSPKTNAMLHERSGQVAGHSLHMDGKAIDVRVEGVALDHLHKAVLGLGEGGVGYYPTSDFVHMDVGKVRRWSGT
jgi:uncharacterized protein YcbK (DUF882 family)